MESQAPKNQSLSCTAEHDFLPLNKICLRPSCYNHCLICEKCSQSYHSGPNHNLVTIDQFKEKYLSTLSQNCNNVDQKFVETLRSSRQRLLQKLSNMQNSMASLIKRLRLAINNQFETIIKSHSAETYPNELASWQQELSAKKIITACYKIIIIKRNQFNGKLQNVLFSEMQYNNKFQIATQKFKDILSEFQELKHVNQLAINTSKKPVPVKSPEQKSKINVTLNAMDIEKTIENMPLKKKKKVVQKVQKEFIEISSQSDRGYGRSREKKAIIQSLSLEQPKIPEKQEHRQKIVQKQNNTQDLNKSKVVPFTITNIPWKKMSQSQVSHPIGPEILQKSSFVPPEIKTKQKLLTFPQKQQTYHIQTSKKDQTMNKKIQENIKNAAATIKMKGQDIKKNQMNKSLVNFNSSHSNQNHSSTSYSMSVMKARQELRNFEPKKLEKLPEKIQKVHQKIVQKKKQEVKHVPRPTQQKIPQMSNISKPPILQKKSSSIVSSDIKTLENTRKQKQIKQKPKDPRNRIEQKSKSNIPLKNKQPEKLKLPEQIIYHQNYISYCGIKRPPRHPLTMKDQQLFEWFRLSYQKGDIYSLILSHRSLDGGNSYEYLLYFEGDFGWVSQKYLRETDQMQRLRDYWAANKIYQNRTQNQVR